MMSIYSYSAYDNEPLKINPKLVEYYKNECDPYLVNLKRELTRSLVDYKLFQDLQEINNSYYKIISGLIDNTYTSLTELFNDSKTLTNNTNKFQKGCYGKIDGDIFDSIYHNCENILITINKLTQTVKTVNLK